MRAFALVVGVAALASGCALTLEDDFEIVEAEGTGGASSSNASSSNGSGAASATQATAGSAGGGETLPTCSDAAKNGTETDIDCGGACTPCADLQQCSIADDCQSGVCKDGSCAQPRCDDDVKNLTETDTDCGSVCPHCKQGMTCLVDIDCESKACVLGVCTHCTNDKKDGGEKDIDCGGPECAPCATGKICSEASDCISGECDDHICV